MKTTLDQKLNTNWFGKIPQNWDVQKISALFDFQNQKVSDQDFEALSVTYGGIKKQLESAAKSDDGSNRKLVRKNDIVVNGRSDRKGAIGISDYDGSVSLIYHVLRKRNPSVDPKYYHYLFRSRIFSEEFFRWGRGIVDDLWTTRTTEMKRIQVPVPPLETQKSIVKVLEQKTEAIQALITTKEKMIAFLNEKRVALIAHSLNKKWNTKKLKFCLKLVTEKGSGDSDQKISLENIEGWTGRLIETDSKYDGEGVAYKAGDILFGKLRPYLAKVYLALSGGEALGDILVYRPNKEILPKFAFYFFTSDHFIDLVNSSTFGARMPRAESFFIGNLLFNYPDIIEQQKIVDFLDEETNKINKAIASIQPQIEKLKEYRLSLIYSIVTGKVKI